MRHLLLNFSHPLTDEQRQDLEKRIGSVPEERKIEVQVPPQTSMTQAATALVDGLNLSAEQWQITPLLIVPPGFSILASVLLAELHGRIGHFPTVVVIRSVPDAPVQTYAIAELINLQQVRERARERRSE